MECMMSPAESANAGKIAHQSLRWVALLEEAMAANRQSKGWRWAQLATARGDGSPAVRTVVVREVDPAAGLIRISTDSRSEKIKELNRDARVELCWMFRETAEQFRVSGAVGGEPARRAAADDLERDRLWRASTDDSRQTFTWPQPGAAYSGDEEFRRPAPETAPDNYTLLTIEPVRVDYLKLQGRPHERLIYLLNGDVWEESRVNP